MRPASRLDATRTAVSGACLAALLLVGSGCRPSPGPAVPDPDLSEMEPQVAELIRQNRSRAQDQPSSADAWGELATVFDAHGLFDPAATCYERAVELDPQDFRWTYLLAIIREAMGADTDEVVRRFDRAAALDPAYVAVLVRKADALSTRGRYVDAESTFRRAIELAPDTATAHRGLGQVLLAGGRAGDAIEPLGRAVELQPADRAALAALAQAYLRVGRTEQAQALIERSRTLQPVHAMSDPVYGRMVLAKSTSSSRVYARAMARIRGGDYAGALVDLEIVRGVRPDDASLHYWMGVCHRALGRRDEALQAFTRSVELNGNLVKARTNLGQLLADRGRLDEAVEQFSRVVVLTPGDASAQGTLGQLLLALDRKAEAIPHLEAAVRIDPTHPAREALQRARHRSDPR